MKLAIFSDLHLEFSRFQPHEVVQTADVVVLTGDIWIGDQGIHWARATWPEQEIVYVAGNHEFYGGQRQAVIDKLRLAAQQTGVHFLDDDSVDIRGTRFLGSTLWTDFRLFGEAEQSTCMLVGKTGLNDFSVIQEGTARFSPQDALKLHEISIDWLENKLKHEPVNVPTVVVTHHAPSWSSVVPRYRENRLSACFASQLDHLLGYSAVWIHGHMHDSLDYKNNGTRVICNPRGYARVDQAGENELFRPDMLVDIG